MIRLVGDDHTIIRPESEMDENFMEEDDCHEDIMEVRKMKQDNKHKREWLDFCL